MLTPPYISFSTADWLTSFIPVSSQLPLVQSSKTKTSPSLLPVGTIGRHSAPNTDYHILQQPTSDACLDCILDSGEARAGTRIDAIIVVRLESGDRGGLRLLKIHFPISLFRVDAGEF